MIFRPQMTSDITGIDLLAPLHWREMPGVVADFWQVGVRRGGRGSYLSPDPRIVVVLEDDDSGMRLATESARRALPLRIGFIPAGVAVRSSFRGAGRLSHLDLHFREEALAARLQAAGLDGGQVKGLVQKPRLLAGAPMAQTQARAMAEEIRADHFSADAFEGILLQLLETLFQPAAAPNRGGLAPSQLARVDRLMRDELHRPIAVAEMAITAELSESWFAHAWAHSRGEPPHRSLQRLRIERACALLSDGDQALAAVAQDVGFADQAHFTRAFRKVTGLTPGLWRRSHLNGK